tara:strand:- start:928 stop:1071 length:144 start_codon:yes stop_codon:yes gene_type:complete
MKSMMLILTLLLAGCAVQPKSDWMPMVYSYHAHQPAALALPMGQAQK